MKKLWIVLFGLYAVAAILYFTHIANFSAWLILAGLADLIAISMLIFISKKQHLYGVGQFMKYLLTLLGLVGASLIVTMNLIGKEYPEQKPFESKISEYASINPIKQNNNIPIKGKAVVVNKGTKEIDTDLLRRLPDDLEAKSPDDVTVVVLVNRGKSKVGSYSNGGGAFVYTCTVTVVDLTTHALIAEKIIQGGAPPEAISGGNGYGSLPDDDVIKYLTELLSNELTPEVVN